jgi:tetratricopeptide (TPR) repeat protein
MVADLAVAKAQGESALPLIFTRMKIKDKTMEIIDRAEQLLREGKYPEAIALYEAVHKTHPEEESVLLMLAWAHYDNGNTSKALHYLENILERELKRKIFTGFAFDELVRIYKQERKFDNLVEICSKAVNAQPQDVSLLAELGSAYHNAGKPKEACQIFEKLIGMENDNPVFYCRWGEALFAAGLTSEAQAAYLRAGEIDPEEADRYYFQLVNLFHNAGNNNEALMLVDDCISANPSNSLYYCSLGDILISLERVDDALAAYKTAIQYDNTSVGVYYNRLGHTLMKAKYFSQAIDAFKAAIEFDAAKPYYNGLASAYEAMGLVDVAHELLQKINTAN